MNKEKLKTLEIIDEMYHKNACETYEDPESECNCGLRRLLIELEKLIK